MDIGNDTVENTCTDLVPKHQVRPSNSVALVFRGLLGSGQLHINKLQRLHGAGTGL